jgi:hypothetical protein
MTPQSHTKNPRSVARVRAAAKPISLATARNFVEEVKLPRVKRSRGAAAAPAPLVDQIFDTAKNQAAVVGSEVVSFVSGVTAERRDAIVNSSLLAQLVAKQKVSDPDRIYDWYDAYFDVLTNIGWVVQDKSFAVYHESSQNFEAHKAILAVAATLLGAAPTALALVSSALKALESMNESSPWITIFSRESQNARTARFQISLAEQDANGQFFVSLMAFGLEAKSSITQVLFFKAKANDATLRHYAGRVTINTNVLDGISGAIREKLSGHAGNYIKALPDLN